MSPQKLPSKNNKCFPYRRRSQDRDDRQQLSIEKQDQAVQRIIKENSLKPIGLPPEEMSARYPGRPIFNEMVERIKQGEAQYIATWALSRLSRNPVDGGMIIHLLDTGKLKGIYTPTRMYRNTSDDKAFLGIELIFAKKNNDDLSDQVKESKVQKHEHGEWPGPAFYGYLNIITGPKRRNIAPDPEKASKIVECFEMSSSGMYQPKDIADHAWEIGLRSRNGGRLAPQTIIEILKRRAYTGIYFYSGEWHQGTYDPIISQELYDKVQLAMGWKQIDGTATERRPYGTNGHFYPYKGLLLCKTCQFNVTAYTKTKKLATTGETAEYDFYTCTKKNKKIACNEPQVSASLLVEEIQRRMTDFEITERDALECKDWVYGLYKTHVNKNGQHKDVWLKDKETAEKALNILDEKLETGIITDERYQLRASVHQQTIERVNQSLGTSAQDAKLWLELSNETFNGVVNLGEVFEIANDEERHRLMRFLGSNWYLHDKSVLLTPRKPLDLLHKDVRKTHDQVWRARPDSNRRSPP